MRLLALRLSAFGPFTETELDLSGGERGLHIVYGPNEAGKSSALRAIHAALFGIPLRSADKFVHDYKDLRVGARLENAAGERLAVLRRKGRSGTLLNPDHAQGAAYPDDALDPFLRGIDSETFQLVYGIDHAALRRGGEELRKLKGLVGESLFAASLGGAALAEVLAALDSEANDLVAKRNSAIKTAKKDYTDQLNRKRDAEVASGKWQQLQAELAQQRRRCEENAQQLKDLRMQQNRVTRIQNTLRGSNERKRLLDELERAGQLKVLPDSYSAAERAQCQAEHQQVSRRIELLKRECNDLRSKIGGIHVPPGVIENEKSITAMDRRAGALEKAATDRAEKVQPERNDADARAQALLRDLKLDARWDELDAFRLMPEQYRETQELATHAKHLHDLPGELSAKQSELVVVLQSVEEELGGLGPARDTTAMQRAVDRVKRHGDIDDQREAVRTTLAAQEAEVERALSNLVLWQGTLSELVRLPVPLEETVERFDRELAEMNGAVDRLLHEVGETQDELAGVRQAVETLQRTDNPPTEDDLVRGRARRDQGWQLVRRAWLEDERDEAAIEAFAEGAALEEAFERSVAEADRISDRLRREADCVAKLAESHAQAKRLQGKLAGSNRALEVAAQRRDAHLDQWRRQWDAAGIAEPLPPREMRQWLARRAILTQSAEQLTALRGESAKLDQRIAHCRRELAEHLETFGEPAQSDESLPLQLARADAALQRQMRTDNRREQLHNDRRRIRSELEQLTEKHRRAVQELNQWKQRWAPAMRLLGCPEDATAERAIERLRRFEELFKYVDEIHRLDARLRGMDDDARHFEEQLAHLVGRVAPELAEHPAIAAATHLRARLEQAQHDQNRLDHLRADIQKRTGDLQDAESEQQMLTARLEQLCRIAGVDSYESLAEIEHGSTEVTGRRARLAQIDEELLELGGGRSVEELVADADGQDGDDLAAQGEALKDEIASVERQRDVLVAQVRDLEIQCAAADGGAAAAEADQQALGLLAKMQDDAQQFCRARLAAAMLHRQIEKHRAENQDPLLERASELFARMTCGEFACLHTEYDQADQPVLVGRRGNGELVHMEAMSDGTRDQIYLALRLGYLQRRLVQHEPMPFVVDDILINFDDHRARATLEVLADLTDQTQVIFFTHHQHLVELAEAAVPGEKLLVHQLDGRRTGVDRPVANESESKAHRKLALSRSSEKAP